MTNPSSTRNLQLYNSPEVTAHYAELKYITRCERLLFESYIPIGTAVLDLGVGGGRTTPYLASRASRYMGIDNAPRMVQACQAKFMGLEFQVADASELSAISDASFGAVIFAFNGIDFIPSLGARHSCFGHIHRILKPGGVFIFSSHNARAIVVRPSWNRERLHTIARKISGSSRFVRRFVLAIVSSIRIVLAFCQALVQTLSRMAKRLPTSTFWTGDGYLLDSAHGGLMTHYSVPAQVVKELNLAKLRFERVAANDYPRPNHPLATDWYYYVFTKSPEK